MIINKNAEKIKPLKFYFQKSNMELDQLPPTGKDRHYEIRAIGVRDFARLERDDSPLNPFDPAQYAKHNLLIVG